MTITLHNVNPPSGSLILASNTITFEIWNDATPTETLNYVLIGVSYVGLSLEEVALDTPSASTPVWKPAFTTSTVTDVSISGSQRLRYTMIRAPLWPDSFKIFIYAFGTLGSSLVTSVTANLYNPPQTSNVTNAANAAPYVPGSQLGIAPVVFDQAHFLAVLQKAYPQDYLQGLQSNPQGGYELLQAAAKVGERVSLAVGRAQNEAFVSTASGGSYATGVVEFFRATASTAPTPYTILQGSRVATADGREFTVMANIAIDTTTLGPWSAPVQAVLQSYQYNLPGNTLAPSGQTVPGPLNQITYLKTNPVVLDIPLQVQQPGPTSGGAFPALDALGEDRGIPRKTYEPDSVYRYRIQTTPDTVSPGAIVRAIESVLGPAPIKATNVYFREVGTPDIPGSPGLPGIFFDAGSHLDSPQNPANNYAYDMNPALRPLDAYKLYLSFLESRAFFMVGVPNLDLGDFGGAYDGSQFDQYQLLTFYDGNTPPGSAHPNNWAYDGFQTQGTSYYQALYSLIDAKRAAGVSFVFYLEPLTIRL